MNAAMCARCVLRQSAHAPQQSAIAGRDQGLVCELFGESKKEHAVLVFRSFREYSVGTTSHAEAEACPCRGRQ